MLFELIAVVLGGVGAGGVAMLARLLSRGRLPRWLVPVAAGAAMLAVAISNEYTWYPRQLAALPEGLKVAATGEDRAVYRPWTYVKPFTARFLAVDVSNERRNDAQPGQLMTEVYSFVRWTPVQRITVAIDCPGARRADVTPDVTLSGSGEITGARWVEVGPSDPVIRTACGA